DYLLPILFYFYYYGYGDLRNLHPFPTRRSSDLPKPPVAAKIPHRIEQLGRVRVDEYAWMKDEGWQQVLRDPKALRADIRAHLERSEEHTSELQSRENLVCRLLLEKKKTKDIVNI